MTVLFCKYGVEVRLVDRTYPPTLQFREYVERDGRIQLNRSVEFEKSYRSNFYWGCFHNGNPRITFNGIKQQVSFDFTIHNGDRSEIKKSIETLIDELNQL